jgi:hypothetical protein
MSTVTKKKKRGPEYQVWNGMIHRCYNPKRHQYPRYGGRGITVCDRWRHSHAAFLEDMGQRPTPKHTLDRIDNDGPYSPENCRWATHAEQRRNRPDCRYVTAFGETLTVTDWANRFGVARCTISDRLNLGWPAERAITEPAGEAVIVAFGKSMTVREWSELTGLRARTIRGRLAKGWSAERALSPSRAASRATTGVSQ